MWIIYNNLMYICRYHYISMYVSFYITKLHVMNQKKAIIYRAIPVD